MSSVFFFALGMSFAYFAVFPIAFGFFADYAPAGVQMMTDIDKYLSFVLTMFIAFGITFEVPVVVIVLVRLGVVSLETLRSIRGYVIVGAFVVGAIFTPPDVAVAGHAGGARCGCCSNWDCWSARFITVPEPEDDAAEATSDPRTSGRIATPRPRRRALSAACRPSLRARPVFSPAAP